MVGIDLFAGAGGMSAGFEKAGFRFILANEIDSDISKTYIHNHPNTLMINCDIKKLCDDFEKALITAYSTQETGLSFDETKEQLKDIDIVIGGPPCQGFSMAGARIRQKGAFINDERNFLFKYYFKVIQRFEPEYFVFENVAGLVTLKKGAILNEIISIFSDKSNFTKGAYNISYKILRASDYGVPQNRNRLIIVGCRKRKIDLDVELDKTIKIMKAKNPNRFDKITIRDAISDLSYLNAGDGEFKQEYRKEPESRYQSSRRSNSYILFNHVSTPHSKKALERIKQITPGENFRSLDETIKSIHSGSYGRMEWDKQSVTITTRFDTPSGGRFIHPVMDRTITPREAARLQSFDDNYVFYGSKTSVGKQIGNAVPPLLAEVLAEMIKQL